MYTIKENNIAYYFLWGLTISNYKVQHVLTFYDSFVKGTSHSQQVCVLFIFYQLN